MRLFVLILLLARCTSIVGQEPYTGTLPKLAPVTPNSAALFKVMERPVGSFTGTTPIDIPMYTLGSGNITVPVALNYHNGGIRVEEIASSVGLGWNLSAGGRITRVMNGIADDRRIGGDSGYIHMTIKPSQFPAPDWPSSTLAGVQNVNQLLRGRKDAEPDLFFFNCGSVSGKFYFDEQNNIRLVEQAPIKIEAVWGSDISEGYHIIGWILRTQNGERYYFGVDQSLGSTAVDYSTVSYSNDHATPPPSSFYTLTWHLVEITDMNGLSAVRFTYDQSYTEFSTLSSGGKALSTWNNFDCQPAEIYSDVQMATVEANEKYLKKIETGIDSLIFYSSGRWDYLGGVKVDSIRHYARNGKGLINRFHLNYSYFGSGSPTTYYWRLKLKNVSEFGSSGNDSVTFRFDYIEDVNLPSRFSRGIDYWGYYNGQDYNWILFPNGTYRNMFSLDPGNDTLFVSDMADRRANAYYAQANTLKKINWPTGGYREFIYESHSILLDVQTQVLPDASFYSLQTFDASDFNTTDPWQPQYRQDFAINSTSGGAAFNFGLDWNYIYGPFTVKLIRMSGGYPSYTVFTFYDDAGGQFDLVNGNYRIEIEYDPIDVEFTSFYAWWEEQSFNWSSTVSRYDHAFYRSNNPAGGIRVKEVRDYDPLTATTSITHYKYQLFDDPTLTSGLLISPVIVSHAGICNYEIRACQVQKLSTGSHYPLSTEASSFVAYPEVRTYETDNGYNDREYSFDFDGVTTSVSTSDFPTVPWPDKGWKRNKLLLEKQYNNGGQLLHKTSALGFGFHNAEWTPTDPWADAVHLMESSQQGFKSIGYWKTYYCDATTYPELPPCGVCWGEVLFESHFPAIKAAKETVYSTTGGSNETLTENSYYTSAGRPLLKKQTIHLNSFTKRETHYVYAFNNAGDFKLGLSAAQLLMKDSLLALNYLLPLEVRTYIKRGNDSVFTGGQKRIFGSYNGNKKYPSEIRYFTTPADSSSLHFSRYDSYGNITEQYNNNGVYEALLWGYDGAYVVARVTGSSYATVSGLVNNTVLQKPPTDGALRTELNNIRTALTSSQAQVTTYTYAIGKGVTSITDPSGKIIFYEYDPLGRLIRLRDQDGNIIKKYDYKVHNP
ncbi:MAG: RHS repeat protein [Niastella sp.]|nr:RHS repeat protein [Niastella sp.]